MRIVQAPGQGGKLQPVSLPCASALQCVGGGAANVDLCVGDPCSLRLTGYIDANTTSSTFTVGERHFGIVVGIEQYWDATNNVMQKGLGNRLPGGTTYGTVYERESRVLVQPLTADTIVECEAAAATYTTYATYLALVGNNVDLTYAGSSATLKKAFPRVDLTTAHTTNTLAWRIFAIPKTTSAGPQDWTSAYVKIWLKANLTAQAPFYTTGV